MRNNKITSIQALRAIAFLGILTSHCRATTLGAFGVSIFIILSGFLMCYSYKDKELPNNIKDSLSFSFKKILKLYPLHIITMIIAIFITIKILQLNFIIKIVLNILLLQSWIPSSLVYFSLNGVSWYLSVCLFLYFAFPFIMKQLRKIKSNKQALLIIIIIFATQVLIGFLSSYLPQSFWIFDNISKWITYIFPLFRLGDFIIGCYLSYLYLNTNIKLKPVIYHLLEIFTIIIIICSEYIYRNQVLFLSSEWFKYTMLYTLLSCSIIYLFAIKKGFITNIITNKLFIYIGNISHFMFLMHVIIIIYFDKFYNRFFSITLNPWIKSILILIITIIVAKIYSEIENKILKKKQMSV